MSRRSFVLLASPFVFFWLLGSSQSAPPSKVAEQSRLATYESASGERFFALNLELDQPAQGQSSPNEVVVLMDTSASQAGAFRDDALATLDNLLAGLGSTDRVKLVAVDLDSVAMTTEFVAANSREMREGLQKLHQRAPLGSTDMLGALTTAAANFSDKPSSSRSIVYIGDGISRANIIQSKEFEPLIKSLVDKRVSVTSFAIGPDRDVHLLATLANHTGGAVLVDANEVTGQQAGRALARAVQADVYWPVAAEASAAVADMFPKPFPPLRAGRDSVVIGTLKPGDVELKASFETHGKVQEHVWKLSPEKSSDDFAFLPKLVEMARADGGLSLPTAGSDMLREQARMVRSGAEGLAKLGGYELSTGNFAGAKSAAEAALRTDPQNPMAAAVRGAADRLAQVPAEKREAELKLINTQAAADAPEEQPIPSLELTEGGEGKVLDEVEKVKILQAKVVQTEVENGLTTARRKMSSAPELAKQDLTLLLDNLDRAVELDADVRAQLRDRIQTAIREAARKQVVMDSTRASEQENKVAAIEQTRLVEEVARDRMKVKQLLDRFNHLLDEGKYRVAEEDIAEQVRILEPDSATGMAALLYSRNLKNVREMARFRDLRHRNFVDALYRVEEAAIPFPDEPPIVYPAADVWEQITMSRKQYRSVDLSGKPGSAENRIQEALEKEDDFVYPNTAMGDVVADISQRFGITVVLDRKALEEGGVGTDTQIDVNYKAITLRSALRLILGEKDLTYMIQDEVLQITTPDKAESKLITKVYPVGDLVIPVISGGGAFGIGGQGGGFGGGGGQGGGGLGGGGGGFGGGGGGFGGGGGGFGGGGGGGFFAVEDELNLSASPKAEAAKPEASRTTPNAKAQSANRIVLPAHKDVSLEAAWEVHFREHANDSAKDRVDHAAAVRETVRQLQSEAVKLLDKNDANGAKVRLNEIVALIHAALRTNHTQSWMYEALSISMLANGSAKSDVERSLMSAVDFSKNEDEVLYVAAYMSKLGLDSRALQLYREVANNNPLRPEPYIRGLSIAKRINDEAAIRWTCTGILTQAWPNENREVEMDARRAAEALLGRMEKENRKKDVSQFTAELKDALVRDCVVRVTWTGDADVDMSIEEPSATVCSLQNRRTTSGGVLIGDAFSNTQAKSPDGYSEYYVCPVAFSGEYRLFIRRLWGNVTAGKVTVEIVTHYGTQEQTYGKQQIPLTSKNAIINFEVKSGRRIQPIEQEQVANVERARLNMGHAILAQQFGPLPDPSTGSSSGSGSVPFFMPQDPRRFDPRFFRRGGSVGYFPIVQPFPEGDQMNTLAIISADRRYVRFTLLGTAPIHSGITEVQTFSFQSSSNQQGGGFGGGGGGQGGGGFGGGGNF